MNQDRRLFARVLLGLLASRALVLKTKPMFLFMNMLFQKQVEPRPTDPVPGTPPYKAREGEDNFNYDE